MVQFQKKFCIFDLEGYMRFVNLDKKTYSIQTEFKIRIGEDAMTSCMISEDKYDGMCRWKCIWVEFS